MSELRSWGELHAFWSDLVPHLGAVVLCPGSRNAPLVLAMPDGAFELHRCLDEREAGYFAIGRAAALGKAVAVITTSGTAVANLYPSLLEARERSIPLWLISADRMLRDRFTAAPQSMDQCSLFGDRIPFYETQVPWGMDSGPLHCNLRLPELGEFGPRAFSVHTSKTPTLLSPALSNDLQPSDLLKQSLSNWLQRAQSGAVLVGALPEALRGEVAKFLKSLGWPVWCEALSGLRFHPDLERVEFRSSERILRAWMKAQASPPHLLRIGAVPTARLWRDVGSDANASLCASVLSLDPWERVGLHRGRVEKLQPGLLDALGGMRKLEFEDWLLRDQKLLDQRQKLFRRHPLAEPSLIAALESWIPAADSVFLGNSLPIREWDLVSLGRHRQVLGSRGLNGIDGLISQSLGQALPNQTLWSVVGDQTAMYGMGGFLWSQDPLVGDHRIVVVNNHGGRIFDRLPALVAATQVEERAANWVQEDHQVNWSHVAQSFGMEYQCWQQVPDLAIEGHSILIELLPDLDQSESFWKEWNELVP
jgi:2-succinyl-5-enolpyruvyl-6-hydroxy-3-cyclohexene-1-carboxylate synthase